MKTKDAFLLIAILIVVGFFFLAYYTQPQSQQVVVTPGQQAITPGYTPWAVGTVKIGLKDKANPTTVITTSTIRGRVYSFDTPDSAVISPTTPYLDSDSDGPDSSGYLSFTGNKLYTATSYKVKIWDSASSPSYYPELVRIDIPALDPSLGASYSYTASDVYLMKIGTFATVLQSCTGAGGGSLPTGVTVDTNNQLVKINITSATSPVTLRCTLRFGNTVANSYLKDVVLHPVADQSSPMPTNAFTSATLTRYSGTDFGLPGDIIGYISGQLPISVDSLLDSSKSGDYYLQFSIDLSGLSSGQKFHFKVDDLGKWLATDDIAGQSGATAAGFTIQIVS